MKREILFHGKRVDNGQWVEGSLIGEDVIVGNIVDFEEDYFTTKFWYRVEPETVGQFTGLTDKYGTKIFEGDVLKFVGGTCDFFIKSAYGHRHEKGTIFTVKWFPSGYTLYESKTKDPLYPNCWSNIGNYDFWNNSRSFEVIGNIYDNPELLK